MRARVRYVAPYDLLDELEEGDVVTVLSFANGYCDIRDEHGRQGIQVVHGVCGLWDVVRSEPSLASANSSPGDRGKSAYEALMSNRQRELAHREEDWGRRPEQVSKIQ